MTDDPLASPPPRADRCAAAGRPLRGPGGEPVARLAPIVAMLGVFALLAGVPRIAFAGPAEPLPGIVDEPAPPAEGGDDEMLGRAMAAYERGQQNYKLAQYDAALADFKEASTLYASPDFQYNIGLCYEKLGQYDEAVLAYVTYLKVKPDAEDRANVEATISRLQQLSRDQKQRAADDDRDTQTVAPGPGPVTPDEPPAPKPWKPLVIAGAVLAGAGATVALGGGIAFGVLAKGRSDDLDAVQNGGNPDDVSLSGARTLESDGKRFETVQIGMAAGGAAVAVVGGALLAVGLLRKKKQAGGATARLVPSFGRQAAGFALVGRF